MIRETEKGISLTSPSLHPWKHDWDCPACGHQREYVWRRWLRILRGKKNATIAKARFCQGSKPPSEEVTGLMALMYYGTDRTIRNECAGLFMPHLHVTCENCGVTWFAETKTNLS